MHPTHQTYTQALQLYCTVLYILYTVRSDLDLRSALRALHDECHMTWLLGKHEFLLTH